MKISGTAQNCRHDHLSPDRRLLKPLSVILAALVFLPAVASADDAVDLGSVTAQGTSTGNSAPVSDSQVMTTQQKLTNTQDVQTVTKDQTALFGPDAGGMQSLAIMPNTLISGYNPTSVSSRSTISMRGVKVGWNSVPGDLETNGITAELDGVPLNSLSQSTGWHSPEIPIGALMSGVNTIDGPGNADTRWYNSLGGSINFIPVQPSAVAGGNVEASYGSFNSMILSAVLNTGEHDGWSTVFGAATAHSQTFRTTSDNMPSRSNQFYMKTQKKLDNGLISFGVYSQYNDEYRPNMIPVVDNSQIHMDGLNGSAPLYSEQSSGYYSTLARDVWFKHNSIENYMAWSHLDLTLASDLTLSNLVWFRDGYVNHYRVNNFVPTNPMVENYNENSKTFGDKVAFDKRLNQDNLLTFGGYMISSRAESDYKGYYPAAGTTNATPGSIGYNTTQSTFWALFAQDTYSPLKRLEIVPGIRLVNFQTDFANNSPTAANTFYPGGVPSSVSYDTNPNESTSFLETEPSLGINYGLNDNLHAFGNYAIARRNPTSNNYDHYPEDIGALRPVRSTSYSLGLRYDQKNVYGLDDLSASLVYFNTLMDNQTIPRTLASNPLVTTFSTGSSTLSGVEFELQAKVNRNWSGFTNLGWLNANWNSFYSPTSNAYYNGMPVSNSPTQTANFGVTYEAYIPSATIETTLWDQFIGKSYLWDNLNGAPTTQSNPAYNLVNLSINAHTTAFGIPGIKDQVTTVSLQAMNMLDKQYNATEYISAGGYFQTTTGGYIIANPGAPRSIYLTLQSSF